MVLSKTLMKLGGVAAILFGVVFALAGAYGLAGGTVTLFGVEVVSAQEGGLIFSIVGIILLLGGIAMTYVGFKPSRLNILSMALGLCSLVIPVTLFAVGHNLVGGIVALVFGYLFLATIFKWLLSE